MLRHHGCYQSPQLRRNVPRGALRYEPRLWRTGPVPSWRMGSDRRFFDCSRVDPGAAFLLREWLTGRGEPVPESVHDAIWGFVPWVSMSLDDRVRLLHTIQVLVENL